MQIFLDFCLTHLQLAHSVLPYLNSVQNSKGTLQIKTVLDFVRQNALTLSPDQKDSSPWDIVSNVVKSITQEASAVVPIALEPENVMKSKPSPFVALPRFFSLHIQ